MRLINPQTGKSALELAFGQDAEVCVTDRRGAHVEETVMRIEGLDGMTPSPPIFADLVTHPQDVAALIYRQLCHIGEMHRGHRQIPRAELGRYTSDELRWAVLLKSEELESHRGKLPSTALLAKTLGLPASTVRRLRAEGTKLFSVSQEELKQLMRKQNADARQTRRPGVHEYREDVDFTARHGRRRPEGAGPD